MINYLYYFSILLLNIFKFFFALIFFISIALTLLWFLLSYLIIFFNFFFKIFIPVYFILSIYSINYKGYYKLNFLGCEANLFKISFYNFVFKIKKAMYNYKIISIMLFIILFIFSSFYEKVYFIIIFFSVFLFILLFYLYNNSSVLKMYI